MFPTLGRLETLRRALQTQQLAVDVANHNVANATTPGFSRQSPVLGTTPPYTIPTLNAPKVGQVGTGVTVLAIRRMREEFLDYQFRAHAEQLGMADAQSSVYHTLDVLLNEPSDTGFAAALNAFWQGWEELANRPEHIPTRQALVEVAQTLANRFNGVRAEVLKERSAVAQRLALQAGAINQIASQIARLNAQITSVLASGRQPNDLLDARDYLLDQLASSIDTTTVVTPDGAVNVYVAGHALVDRDRTDSVQLAVDPTTGNISFTWGSDGSAVAASLGSAAGLLTMHNTTLPSVLADLDALRDTLVAEVNGLHQTGYGLSDPGPTPPGRDFFEVLPNGDLRVLPALLSDPALIAAASAPGVPGNADIALAIAGLADKLTMLGGTSSINDFYAAVVARIGRETERTAGDRANLEALTRAIDRRRQEVSGVSLDEEALNLVTYQRAYQAAARAMTVVDEMLDRLINGTGLVGR
ncbi:MAG: flagellar hook-associated protein FlgK [Sphaerobacter sp.]|nr:flagellar hook-associated protein FlgK [Sphaerobacter sp.]